MEENKHPIEGGELSESPEATPFPKPSASPVENAPQPPTSGEQNGTPDSANSPGTPKKKPSKRTRIILSAVGIIVLISIIGSFLPCNHEWVDATCTEPKTCEKCGETEGKALGHDWKEATCTEPKTCSRCGETEGVSLGHEVTEWVVDTAATCSATGSQHGVCTRCGETLTETIPMTEHTEGEWTVTEAPAVTSSGTVTPGTRSLTCSVCGAVIRTEEINLEVTVSQQNALRSAQSYLDFMAFSYSGLIDQLEYEGYSTEDATFAADYCGADWNEQAALSAQSYLDFMAFSRAGLIDQLMYEGFTREQAEYGANAVGL